MADRPSNRPTVSELVTTDDAPDWRTNGTFSCSLTETTTPAVGLSWRTVSVARSEVPSRRAPRFAKVETEQRTRRARPSVSSTMPRRSPL